MFNNRILANPYRHVGYGFWYVLDTMSNDRGIKYYSINHFYDFPTYFTGTMQMHD